MIKTHLSLVLVDGFFLKYHLENLLLHIMICHNPYFNRWISAINPNVIKMTRYVTILILIDGFLQYYSLVG